MKVFKFGGVSIKDAPAIEHVAQIIGRYQAEKPLVVVISAMGKTTNALEAVLSTRRQVGVDAARDALSRIIEQHHTTARQLGGAAPGLAGVLDGLREDFQPGWNILGVEPMPPFGYAYDQLVSCGEMASSRLLAFALEQRGLDVLREDARHWLITDAHWRHATPDHLISSELVSQRRDKWAMHDVVVVQGFIGGTMEGHTTTLGREGSDYTAAMLANWLDVEEMTVWKDVPGILNGDPKKMPDAQLLPELSFEEAIEMTFYGARVLHPQTIQPLKQKGILLNVRSFLHPEQAGTRVGGTLESVHQPIVIIKENQQIVDLTTRDLSFIDERNLSYLFWVVAEYDIEVHMMQTSAVTFSMVIDADESRVAALRREVAERFVYEEVSGLRLITVRHATQAMMEQLRGRHEVWLEQMNDVTTKLLVVA
jgi:aspartate kinase